MKPETIAAAGTEHAHQVALFCWCAQNREKYPVLRWFHSIPNGGLRDKITASRLKAEGVRSGVSDTCLPVARGGFHGLYIEMKKPKGKESEEQIEFGAFLTEQGYKYACCDTWEKARDVLVEYLES